MFRAITGLSDAPNFGLTPTVVIRFYSLQSLLDRNPAMYHIIVSAELSEVTLLALTRLQQTCLRSPWTKHRHDRILGKFGNFVQILWQQRRLFMKNDGTVGSLSDTDKVMCNVFETPGRINSLTASHR